MRERLAGLAYALLLAAIVTALAFLSTRYGIERDFSHEQGASLSPATRALLQSLDGPVEVVCYARPDGNMRKLIAAFVARYQRVKPDVRLEFVDPDADPDAMRAAGVTLDGEFDLRYGGRSERLKVLGEAEFSNALLRLSRPGERIVAFLEGEGERDALGKANADLGNFTAALVRRGIHPAPLPLAATGKIPDNTNLVVVANPAVALAPATVSALVDWVGRGGNLLWLTAPDEHAGLDALADALSVRVLPGTVVDGGGHAFGISDPSFVAVSSYPASTITDGFALTTLLPQPAGLAQLSGSNWMVHAILRSSKQSWNETGPIPKAGDAAGTIRQDADAGEIPGPLDLGFALSRLSPAPGKREQRVVVLGDGAFLSNTFLGNGGNREFGERVFDWLLGDDGAIRVPDHNAPDRRLELGQRAIDVIGFGFLLVLPLLLVVTGGLVWWWRRRR